MGYEPITHCHKCDEAFDAYHAPEERLCEACAESDADYWYEHRNELEEEQIFRMYDGSLVKLDRRVPGDGTQWYVAEWHNGWSYYDSKIEPCDLRGKPLPTPVS